MRCLGHLRISSLSVIWWNSYHWSAICNLFYFWHFFRPIFCIRNTMILHYLLFSEQSLKRLKFLFWGTIFLTGKISKLIFIGWKIFITKQVEIGQKWAKQFSWPVLRLQCSSPMVMAFPGGPSIVMAIPWRPSLASDGTAIVHRWSWKNFEEKNSFKLRFDIFI